MSIDWGITRTVCRKLGTNCERLMTRLAINRHIRHLFKKQLPKSRFADRSPRLPISGQMIFFDRQNSPTLQSDRRFVRSLGYLITWLIDYK